MVWLKRVAVGAAERIGELLVRVGEVMAESLRSEVEATDMVWLAVEVGIVSGGEGYRFSHTRPSVAVCFFSLSSFRTSSCSVPESVGAASCRSLIF